MHSNHSSPFPSIPQDTARAVADSFDEENFYIKIGSSLEIILQDLNSLAFERPLRQSSIPAYVYSLVTIFQYQERLTDEEMAEAVRDRPEVRFGLRLSMRHPNISASNLCQYRQLLFENSTASEACEKILERVMGFAEQNVNGSSKYSVPEAICLNNRTNKIVTSMLETLGTLAAVHPNWMRKVVPAYWYERYNRSFSRFVKEVLEKGTQEMIMEIGNDMKYVLDLAKQEQQIANLIEVKNLTQVLHENFEFSQISAQLEWKPILCTFCSRRTLQKLEVK